MSGNSLFQCAAGKSHSPWPPGLIPLKTLPYFREAQEIILHVLLMVPLRGPFNEMIAVFSTLLISGRKRFFLTPMLSKIKPILFRVVIFGNFAAYSINLFLLHSFFPAIRLKICVAGTMPPTGLLK